MKLLIDKHNFKFVGDGETDIFGSFWLLQEVVDYKARKQLLTFKK